MRAFQIRIRHFHSGGRSVFRTGLAFALLLFSACSSGDEGRVGTTSSGGQSGACASGCMGSAGAAQAGAGAAFGAGGSTSGAGGSTSGAGGASDGCSAGCAGSAGAAGSSLGDAQPEDTGS